MTHGRWIAGLAALALAQQVPPAMAQTAPAAPTQAAAPLDEANLALGKEIIAVIVPPDQRMSTITRMQQALIAPMRANLQLPPEMNDPGLNKIFQDYLENLPEMMRPLMAQYLPGLFDAMARAYARNFTHAELEQILAFAHTPVGAKYFARSTMLMQDPDVTAANGELMRAGQKATMAAIGEMQGKIRAYMTAHPEVAKRLQEQAAHKQP